MVGQALFLFVDVELLDIVDELLLQTVAVVFDIGDALEPLDDALANLLDARLLVGLDAGQQAGDIVDVLVELHSQGLTLLLTEVDEQADGLFYGLSDGQPLLVGERLYLGLAHHVGHSGEQVEPVGRFGDAHLGGNVTDLPVIVFHHVGIDGRSIDGDVFLQPDGKVHLAALQGGGEHLPYLHLFVAID